MNLNTIDKAIISIQCLILGAGFFYSLYRIALNYHDVQSPFFPVHSFWDISGKHSLMTGYFIFAALITFFILKFYSKTKVLILIPVTLLGAIVLARLL